MLKKKSSKKEETDKEYESVPSSTINTHIEENLFFNGKKKDENNSNMSLQSIDSLNQFKKEVENLILSRVNTPASSNKNILTKLDVLQKKLEQTTEQTYYKVNTYRIYRQFIKEIVPMLRSFLNHNNADINQKAKLILDKIKDQVCFYLFDTKNLNNHVELDLCDYDKEGISKSLDNHLKQLRNEKHKACNIEKKTSFESISENLLEAQDMPFDYLFKKDVKRPKINISPLYNSQIQCLFKDFVQIDSANCEDFIHTLRTCDNYLKKEDMFIIPDNKRYLRKNICIQLLNIFEKIVIYISNFSFLALIMPLSRRLSCSWNTKSEKSILRWVIIIKKSLKTSLRR